MPPSIHNIFQTPIHQPHGGAKRDAWVEFRALSGRLKFTFRRHKFNKDYLSRRPQGQEFEWLGYRLWLRECLSER